MPFVFSGVLFSQFGLTFPIFYLSLGAFNCFRNDLSLSFVTGFNHLSVSVVLISVSSFCCTVFRIVRDLSLFTGNAFGWFSPLSQDFFLDSCLL